MERKIFQALELKIDGDGKVGTFKGYASIFENTDLGGDVMRKGAFKEIVTNKAGQVKVLFSHDAGGLFGGSGSGGLPIGLARVEQNSKGLKFDGELVMEDPFVGQRVYPHMKAGSLDGMSIGFDILPGGAKILENGTRELTGVKLWEISPVIWGMNPKAHISDVKSIETVRQVETWLRDEVGLSNVKAKIGAPRVWSLIAGLRDGGSDDDAREAELTKQLHQLFTS